MTQSLYDVLGVARDAEQANIRRAHRNLIKAHHPDHGGDPDTFRTIQTAYEVLSDPERRKRYDDTGDAGDLTQQTNVERAAALEMLAALAVEALGRYDAKVVDMRKRMCDMLDQATKDADRNLTIAKTQHERHKADIAKARELRARWKPKSPGDDVIGSMLDGHIATLEAKAQEHYNEQIAKRELTQRAHKLALDILSGYDYTTDKPSAAEVLNDKALLAGLWNETPDPGAFSPMFQYGRGNFRP